MVPSKWKAILLLFSDRSHDAVERERHCIKTSAEVPLSTSKTPSIDKVTPVSVTPAPLPPLDP